jgi:aldose 1-epimerase
MTRTAWGTVPVSGGFGAGLNVERVVLTGAAGVRAEIGGYGAALLGLRVPDRDGVMGDVVLGFDGLDEYLADQCYFGAVVGRVANRINGARFPLDGAEFSLDRNWRGHHLHGGTRGFSRRSWAVESVAEGPDGPSATLSLVSPDGDQGYPGEVRASATYTVTGSGLRLTLRAASDAPTVVCLAGHAYFNLGGNGSRDIRDHRITLKAGRYLAVDDDLIPTGEIPAVDGTPFDFSRPVLLGERVGEPGRPLTLGQGIDQCFVLDGEAGRLRPAARVVHQASGRVLEVWTTQPAVHLYTAGFVPRGLRGRGGTVYGPGCGLCLETQGYPDAANRPEFPSVALRPGQEYEQTTEYRFTVLRGAEDAMNTGGETWHTSS